MAKHREITCTFMDGSLKREGGCAVSVYKDPPEEAGEPDEIVLQFDDEDGSIASFTMSEAKILAAELLEAIVFG